MVLVTVVFAVLYIQFDFFESIYEVTRLHENLQLDELLAVLPVLAVMASWFCYRRWVQSERLNRELKAAIAEKDESNEQARIVRERFWESMNTLQVGFAIYDPSDRLVVANQAFKDMHAPVADMIEPGASFEEIVRAGIERDIWDIGDEDVETWIRKQVSVRTVLDEFETEVKFADGRTMIRRERRTPSGEIIGVRIDVTRERQREDELKQAKRELEDLVYFDRLTGLGNRAACEAELQRRLTGPLPGNRFALIHFDIDRFKQINDTKGHVAGDELLKEVGHRLKLLTNELAESTAYRWGGDEFIVIISRTAKVSIEAVCQEINDLLGVTITIDGTQVWPSASVGVALHPEDGQTLNSLLVYADLALYEAKDKGRDRYHFFTSELKERVENARSVEQELRRALVEDELEVHFQPQVSSLTGSTTGIEALIRWRHPERGLLNPKAFVPFAEQANLAVPIGQLVVAASVRAASTWLRDGLEFGRIATNISQRHLDHESFVEGYLNCLKSHSVPASSMTVEVVESVLIDDEGRNHAEILRRLNEEGVSVELDDFGTGYASLSHLVSLPLDGVKIDKSFIDDLLHDTKRRGVVEAIAQICRTLNVRMVCEGIESRDQLEALRGLGDMSIQGYFIAKPMDHATTTEWLRSRGNRSAAAQDGPAAA